MRLIVNNEQFDETSITIKNERIS